MMSLLEVRNMIGGVVQVSDGFPDELMAIMRATDKVLDKIRNRVGPDGMDKLGVEVNPKDIAAEMNNIRSAMEQIAKYIEYSTLVMDRNFVGDLRAACLASVDLQQADTDNLVEFAKLHKAAMASHFRKVECTAEVADLSLVARLSSELSMYSKGTAHLAFTTNSAAFAELCVASVVAAMPKCSLIGVHSKVLADKKAEEVIPMLIVGADLDSISLKCLDFCGLERDERFLQSMPYHIKLEAINSFVLVSELPEVAVPGVSPASSQSTSQNIPTLEALAILDALALCCDLTSIATTLHNKFSLKVSGGVQLPPSDVLVTFVHLLVLYKATLDKADLMMQSEGTMMVERSALRMDTPFSVLRCWRDGMACYAGHVQKSLLGCWVVLLDGAIHRCKGCTPSWQVIFQFGRFDLGMATKVLSDKLGPLMHSHNEAHKLLKDPRGPCL